MRFETSNFPATICSTVAISTQGTCDRSASKGFVPPVADMPPWDPMVARVGAEIDPMVAFVVMGPKLVGIIPPPVVVEPAVGIFPRYVCTEPSDGGPPSD